ncbi:PQQ-dependent sugar dehydrogenase [Psychroserpens sp.]|uniref:PQQ-dependent sugar dehydrogenase n=1 Tax=Psychroserpens sp. TaxID=2020870 RepID=UPI003C72B25D
MTFLRQSLLFIGLISVFACAQDKTPIDVKHSYELIVPDLQNPWGFVFMPDQSMLINEKDGRMIHFKNGKKIDIKNVPTVYNRGQGGLLDIKLHPNYTDNGWIYMSYASSERKDKGGHTAIMRAKLVDGALIEKQLLYKATPNTTKGQHFGSRIVFDDKGYLFFTIGERGNRDENPQDLTRDGGKVYRLNDDGSVPEDNPFVKKANAKTAIFSYGHRNPQGMVIHPETRAIWTHEHGPKGGDEINIIEAGKNYGWPIITYGVNYSGTQITNETSRPGMEQPIHYWDPSIAPSGMEFISSDTYGDWKGDLLVGSLKFQYLDHCYIDNGKVVKEERLLNELGRVRSINQGPDGFIYVGIENLGIVKLIKTK